MEIETMKCIAGYSNLFIEQKKGLGFGTIINYNINLS